MAVELPERIWAELKRSHHVDEFLFPGVDLGRLPSGPVTEVRVAAQALIESGLPASTRNIATELDLKRRCFVFLGANGEIQDEIRAKIRPRAGATFPISFELAQYVVDGILLLIASGFLAEMGADAYRLLKRFFTKRLRNEAEVEVLVKATSAFVQSGGEVVVKIGRKIQRQTRRTPRRKK